MSKIISKLICKSGSEHKNYWLDRAVYMYIYIYIYTYIYIYIYIYVSIIRENCLIWKSKCCYGVATISRLLKIVGLFCRISSLLQGSFAEETYDFKEPTNRSHPIVWSPLWADALYISRYGVRDMCGIMVRCISRDMECVTCNHTIERYIEFWLCTCPTCRKCHIWETSYVHSISS